MGDVAPEIHWSYMFRGFKRDGFPDDSTMFLDYRHGEQGNDSLFLHIQNDDSVINSNRAWEQDNVIMDLTDDLLHLVFSFLDHNSLCASAMVCRQWHAASMHEDFWQSLNFEGENVTEEKVGWLCLKYPKAVGLSLKEVPCIDEVAREAMYSLQRLQRLNICKGNLTDCFFNALSHGCYALKELTITDARLGNGGTEEVLIRHESLYQLQIKNCRVTRVTVRCPLLDRLSLKSTSISSAKLQCPMLHSLDMSSCHNLSDDCLCSAITACPVLLSLDVSECTGISDNTLKEISLSCSSLETLNVSHCPNVTNENISLAMLKQLRFQNLGSSNDTAPASRLLHLKCLMFNPIRLDPTAFLTSVSLNLQELRITSLASCDRLFGLMLHCHPLVNISVPKCLSLKHNSILSVAAKRLSLQPRAFTLHTDVHLFTNASRLLVARSSSRRLIPPPANSCKRVCFQDKIFKRLPAVTMLANPSAVSNCRKPKDLIVFQRPILQHQAFTCLPDVDLFANPRVSVVRGGCHRLILSSLNDGKHPAFRCPPDVVFTNPISIVRVRPVLSLQRGYQAVGFIGCNYFVKNELQKMKNILPQSLGLQFYRKSFANEELSLCFIHMKLNADLVAYNLNLESMPVLKKLLTLDCQQAMVKLIANRYHMPGWHWNNRLEVEHQYYIFTVWSQLNCKRILKSTNSSCHVQPFYCNLDIKQNILKRKVNMVCVQMLNHINDMNDGTSAWNPFALNVFCPSNVTQLQAELFSFLSQCTASGIKTRHQQLLLQSCSPNYHGTSQEGCSSTLRTCMKIARFLPCNYYTGNAVKSVEEVSILHLAPCLFNKASVKSTVNGGLNECIHLIHTILNCSLNIYGFPRESKAMNSKLLHEIIRGYSRCPDNLGLLDPHCFCFAFGNQLDHQIMEDSNNVPHHVITFYLDSFFQHKIQETEAQVPYSVSVSFLQYLNFVEGPEMDLNIINAICFWDPFTIAKNIKEVRLEYLYLTVLYLSGYIALQELLLVFAAIQPLAAGDVSQNLSSHRNSVRKLQVL